jgi:hypothetical protein
VSVEIRATPDGLECDWGIIGYQRPDIGRVDPVVLVSNDYVAAAIAGSTLNLKYSGAVGSVTVVNLDEELTEESELRLFWHIEHRGQRWTWELQPGHFADDPDDHAFVGRWPD